MILLLLFSFGSCFTRILQQQTTISVQVHSTNIHTESYNKKKNPNDKANKYLNKLNWNGTFWL